MINSRLLSKQQNVCYTLPITCQICLSKVKEPTVCPNLHAFCSTCISTWLEKTKQCPTCRIQIDSNNPCRKVLGGIENVDDVDMIKPTEFSNPASRKARYMGLFQDYEDEINRLNSLIDSQNDEITKLKESGRVEINEQPSSDQDLKIESIQKDLEQVLKERDELKEENKKLNSENSILIQDIVRLKNTLNEKNSQITSKYTMAALESKMESYEKENKQLQKALEKSDKYITELELKLNMKNKENNETGIPSQLAQSSSFIKPRVSQEIDSIIDSSILKNVIPKNNFYGSPSKTPTHSNTLETKTVPSVSSFSDRLKKNLFNIPKAPEGFNFGFDSDRVNFVSNQSEASNQSNNLLFSPMKRLRIEESDKPQE